MTFTPLITFILGLASFLDVYSENIFLQRDNIIKEPAFISSLLGYAIGTWSTYKYISTKNYWLNSQLSIIGTILSIYSIASFTGIFGYFFISIFMGYFYCIVFIHALLNLTSKNKKINHKK